MEISLACPRNERCLRHARERRAPRITLGSKTPARELSCDPQARGGQRPVRRSGPSHQQHGPVDRRLENTSPRHGQAMIATKSVGLTAEPPPTRPSPGTGLRYQPWSAVGFDLLHRDVHRVALRRLLKGEVAGVPTDRQIATSGAALTEADLRRFGPAAEVPAHTMAGTSPPQPRSPPPPPGASSTDSEQPEGTRTQSYRRARSRTRPPRTTADQLSRSNGASLATHIVNR